MSDSIDNPLEELATDLGPDLVALVCRRPSRCVRCIRISAVEVHDVTRSTFRFDFEDGTSLKGRRFEDPRRTARVVALQSRLPSGFAPLVESAGDALLTQWVEGSPVDQRTARSPAFLSHCGSLLGRLHGVAPPWVEPEAVLMPSNARQRLEHRAQGLAEAGLLSKPLSQAIRQLAAEAPADDCGAGILHWDLCPENVILDASGSPIVVDNGGLRSGAHDLDLARSWYRWPMGDAERNHFVRGYEQHRSLESFRSDFFFWMAVALTSAATFRHRSGVAGARERLSLLSALLERRIEA